MGASAVISACLATLSRSPEPWPLAAPALRPRTSRPALRLQAAAGHARALTEVGEKVRLWDVTCKLRLLDDDDLMNRCEKTLFQLTEFFLLTFLSEHFSTFNT